MPTPELVIIPVCHQAGQVLQPHVGLPVKGARVENTPWLQSDRVDCRYGDLRLAACFGYAQLFRLD